MNPAVSVERLAYRHASRKDPALRDVSFEVAPGEIVLLTGDTGAGKSTLLHALAGVLGDAEDGELQGSVLIDGTVGLVLQDPDSQVISSRVGDDVAFGAENLGVDPDEIWPRVRRSLEIVGLDLPLDHPTQHLSGGQKQRLALAGVLAMEPSVILLDEPTANLDPQGRQAIVEAVGRVVRETGAAVVIAEHRAHHWLSLNPTLYHLDQHGIHPLDRLPDPPQVSPAQPLAAGSEPVVWADTVVPKFGHAASFELPAGSSTTLTGPNGSGKSTLLATIGGLFAPRSGTINYSEQLRRGISGPAHRWRSSALAQRIGHVFQDPEHQFAYRTVAEELAGPHNAPERVEELLVRLRLDHLRDANPFTLSGGQKRRLSVASALVSAPEVVLLDEPTFGQDDYSFLELVNLTRELTQSGVTVVSITHDELYRRALGQQEITL